MECDLPIPVLGLILSQKAPIKLTEQSRLLLPAAIVELISMYYTYPLTGHFPDVAIRHGSDALPGT